MKCAIVPMSVIRKTRFLRLDADLYADPGAGYDKAIATTEKTLAQATVRLADLKARQAADIAERKALGIVIVGEEP